MSTMRFGHGVVSLGALLAGCLGGPDGGAAPGGSACGIGTSPSLHEECLTAIETVVDERSRGAPVTVRIVRDDRVVFALEGLGVGPGSAVVEAAAGPVAVQVTASSSDVAEGLARDILALSAPLP